MKVGIITQALLNNYGGILQNYALQQVLKGMGHDVITIDYVSHFSFKKYIIYILKTFLLLLLNKRRKFLPFYRKRNLFNQQFVSQYIRTTVSVKKYTAQIIKDYNLDAIVVGSDQVWRPEYNNDLYAMYLSFANDDDNLIRVAYAASFGIDQWTYTEKQTEKCKKLAKRFNAISVREKSGIKLCEENLEVKAIQVLDPTLLIDKEKYEELCKDVPVNNTSFLAAYILDLNKEKEEFIYKIAKERNLPIKMFRADTNASLSIQEWLAVFRDAKYVITDSYHGTLFSIIFRKDFLTIGNGERGLSRFNSILSTLHLSERLTNASSLHSYNISNVDWRKVETLLLVENKKSYYFLDKSLNSSMSN